MRQEWNDVLAEGRRKPMGARALEHVDIEVEGFGGRWQAMGHLPAAEIEVNLERLLDKTHVEELNDCAHKRSIEDLKGRTFVAEVLHVFEGLNQEVDRVVIDEIEGVRLGLLIPQAKIDRAHVASAKVGFGFRRLGQHR